MSKINIILEINISELEIRDSKIAEPGTEWVTWKIENQEKIEAKIYSEFKAFIEPRYGKVVVKSGASAMIQFPESFYLKDKEEA